MNKIKITKSQMALIKESLKKPMKVKLTSAQVELIKESMGAKPTVETPNVLQFGQFITEAINAFFAQKQTDLEVPEAIQAMGVKANELKYRLLRDKIINIVDGEDGETYQFNSKGFGEWCSQYYNDLIGKPEIQEDYDGNHWNNSDGTAPWEDDRHYEDEEKEEDFEFSPNDDVNVITVNTGFDELVVLKVEGQIVLFQHDNMSHFKMMELDQVAHNLIHGDIERDHRNDRNPHNTNYEAFGNNDAFFLMVTPKTVKSALHAVKMLYGEVGKIPAILEHIFTPDEEIMEMTTTGSVGGSYETPQAWSKDPNKPRHSDKPMIKGGKFLNESLVFKKDTPNNRFVLYSDASTMSAKNGETARPAYMIKQHGFKWDKELNGYVSPMDNFDNVLILKEKLFKCEQTFTLLEEVEEYIHQIPDIPAEVIATGEKMGVKTTRKEEVEATIEKFYDDLQKDLDGNKYIKFSEDYLRFTTMFSDKFDKNYSPNNMMLIFIQRPNSKAVGTKIDWEKEGRRIKKGAKGILLYKPTPYKQAIDKDKAGTADDNDENYVDKVGFSTFYVFDFRDTQSTDGTEDPTELENDWQASNAENPDAEFLAGIVKEIIQEEGIKLTNDDARGSEGGFSAGKWINISKGSQGERLLSDLVHEFAHELIHQKTGLFYKGGVKLSSDVKEIHAEGVAIAIMNYFHFDITPNKVYLESWGKMGASIKDNVQIMTSVASYVLKKINQKINAVKEA